MTVLEILHAATDYLHKQGIENPRLNAEHLLAYVLRKRNRIDLYLDFERIVNDTDRAALRELIRERGRGRPLQHLLGNVEFLGHFFYCDGRALIPRPETEQLVELVLSFVTVPAPKVLDVGTGSGVIALSLALTRPQASILACDISSEALALAQKNAIYHQLQDRVRFIQSDLLDEISGSFDAVVANLPYISSTELPKLAIEVRHDPEMALDGGEDGLRLIEKLIATAFRAMAPGALLALEIDDNQTHRCQEILEAYNYRDIAAYRDYQNCERFIIARYG